eukprot:EG_transcript_40838
MQLGFIFAVTLAISVILSSTSIWGLTYSTSYIGLQEMSSGYLRLTRLAMDNFAQLMSQLITDSSALAVNILDVEYQRSAAQTNETGGQFLQTAADMAVQARNASSQAQALVV